jgi:hypothetical protein
MDEGAKSVSDTILSLYQVETDIAEQIKGLCAAVSNDTMFAEHPHLLVAALSALKAAKGVLTSLTDEQLIGNSAGHRGYHHGSGQPCKNNV